MRDSTNNSFAGLPVVLVNEILGRSGQVAEQLYKPFGEITGSREKLREQLLENKIIHTFPNHDGIEVLTSCGVDGYCSIENFFTSDLAFSAAFAVEGLVPPSGKPHWTAPHHQSLFYSEKHAEGTGGILNAIKMEMAVELAAQAPHEIVLFRGSFIEPFSTVFDTLKPSLEQKDLVTSQEFLTRFKTFILSYKTIFETSDTKKMWVGFQSNATRNELIGKMNVPDGCNASILFTVLLSPGEFTVPVPVDQADLARIKNITIKDEKFAAVKDTLISQLSTLHVLYFRPRSWTPAFRIEVSQAIAGNSEQLARLLRGITYQCITAGIKEPYPLNSAKSMVRNMEKAMPSLHQSLTAYITNVHSDDLGELFPLLIFND